MKKLIPITVMTLILNACSEKKELPMIEKKEIKLESRLMSPEVLWSMGRLGNAVVSPDAKKIAYTVSWYDISQNASNSEIYIMDIDGSNKKQLTTTRERESGLQWRGDGEYIGFIRGGKLFEIKPDGSEEREISGIDKLVNEFSYSPDGKKMLLAITTEVTKVLGKDIYPDLPKANAYTTNDLMYRHWDSWNDGSFSHLYTASYNNGNISNIEDIMPNEAWDAPMTPFDDISETSWSPNGRFVAYSCKKKTGKEYAESTDSDIYIYDTESKKTENITTGMYGYDKHPAFSPDGKKLLWLSMERAGYEADKSRIFIYDFETKTKVNYSEHFDSSPSSIVWAKDGKSLLLTACFNETFRVFSMNIAESVYDFETRVAQFEQLSEDGFFDYQNVQEIDNGFIVTRTQITRPSEIYRLDAKSGRGTELSFINKHITDQLDLPEMELRWVATTDNKEMPMWVILPPKMDKSKQYPCIMMCTGGPQGEISQSYSYRWNYALMASQGYVVIYPGRRGVSGYGQEWSDAVSKDHGGQPERDLLSAIDYISKEPWVDETRLGAVGASYGGFSIFWLAGNHNKRFKAFIAHCGIFNLEAMYTTTEELFFENWEMGGPFWDKSNSKVYNQAPIKFVENWDTPILIFHGERDYRVPYTQGMAAFNAARMRNVPARMVVFPEETHWVVKPQNAILWQREFFAWLNNYLK